MAERYPAISLSYFKLNNKYHDKQKHLNSFSPMLLLLTMGG